MCKICGRLVTKEEGQKVRMADRMYTVCSSCSEKKIPMLTPIPGRF